VIGIDFHPTNLRAKSSQRNRLNRSPNGFRSISPRVFIVDRGVEKLVIGEPGISTGSQVR
jgi:hypothetical protein